MQPPLEWRCDWSGSSLGLPPQKKTFTCVYFMLSGDFSGRSSPSILRSECWLWPSPPLLVLRRATVAAAAATAEVSSGWTPNSWRCSCTTPSLPWPWPRRWASFRVWWDQSLQTEPLLPLGFLLCTHSTFVLGLLVPGMTPVTLGILYFIWVPYNLQSGKAFFFFLIWLYNKDNGFHIYRNKYFDPIISGWTIWSKWIDFYFYFFACIITNINS